MSKPITTDLRRWFDQHMKLMADDELREGFGNLCDAIDATVANLELENDALYAENDALRHERDDGWVELPKDADGEYIHFGDTLSQFDVPMYVFAMSDPDPDQGDCMICLTDEFGGKDEWVRARKMRHHTPDTWERIIEDAIDAVDDCWANDEHDKLVDALVARCRALAGDA